MMRKMIMAGVVWLGVLAGGEVRADSVASWNFGLTGASSRNAFNSAVIRLGIWEFPNDVGDGDPAVSLFNVTLSKPAAGDFTFTADASDPNWTAGMNLLHDGNNHALALITDVGDGSPTMVGAYLLPLSSVSWATIFPSQSAFTAQPITSLTLDVTDFAFTTQKVFGDTYYGVTYDAVLSFNAGESPSAAVPLPGAFEGGLAMLACGAAAGIGRRKRVEQ